MPSTQGSGGAVPLQTPHVAGQSARPSAVPQTPRPTAAAQSATGTVGGRGWSPQLRQLLGQWGAVTLKQPQACGQMSDSGAKNCGLPSHLKLLEKTGWRHSGHGTTPRT